jgi:hypothetical protein
MSGFISAHCGLRFLTDVCLYGLGLTSSCHDWCFLLVYLIAIYHATGSYPCKLGDTNTFYDPMQNAAWTIALLIVVPIRSCCVQRNNRPAQTTLVLGGLINTTELIWRTHSLSDHGSIPATPYSKHTGVADGWGWAGCISRSLLIHPLPTSRRQKDNGRTCKYRTHRQHPLPRCYA